MNEITVRTASMEDLTTLLRFEQGVIHAERPFDVTIKEGEIRYYDIPELIHAENVELVVAESDSEVIGCGYARIEKSQPYLKHERHAYIGFIFVEPDHRGKGVSERIMDALRRWSLQQNVNEMRLEVYTDNVRAIRAYEKAGFKKHMLEMRMGI